jgi:hypothetical protein
MRATWPAYGDQEVSLMWDDETGWSVGWGPAGDVCGASFTVCRSLVPEPAEVVAAARAALTAPPTEDVPCPFRSRQEHDEELETVLDTYTRRETLISQAPTVEPGDSPLTVTSDTAYDDARIIAKGIRLSGSREIVTALEAALTEGPLTPDLIERFAHPDWDRVTFEEEAGEPVSEGAEAVGLARLYGPGQTAAPGLPPSWCVAASWYGWLPGAYEDRTAALLAYGYVLGGECHGPLEDVRNQVNRRERRPMSSGDLAAFVEGRAEDAGA